MEKKLYKSRTDIKLDGVCSGIAKYFNIDPTLVRIVWVVVTFFGWGLLAYIVCALVMPREPETGYTDYTPPYDYDNQNHN